MKILKEIRVVKAQTDELTIVINAFLDKKYVLSNICSNMIDLGNTNIVVDYDLQFVKYNGDEDE